MRVIEDGAGTHLANGLRGYFLTLTAPGENEHKRWYQGKRPRTRPDCDCHRHGRTDGEWNRQESKCWNRLRTSLARDRELIYVGAVETQARGMLHRHLVVLTDEPLDYGQVQEQAIRAGYGCVVDVEPLMSAEKAARYVAKYVTKSTSERPSVPWSVVHLDEETGELVEVHKRASFRLWSSAHRWGVTMKQVKAVASAQARARALYLQQLEAALLEESRSAAGPEPADSPSTGPP